MRPLIFYLLLVLSGCAGEPPNHPKNVRNDSTSPAPDGEVVEEPYKPGLKDIRFGVEVVRKTTPWKGDVMATVAWTDAKGKHLCIVSEWDDRHLPGEEQEGREELYAYTYTLVDSIYHLRWQINDFEVCLCDAYINYADSTLAVTDVDSNGVGEVSFLYHKNMGDNSLNMVEECKLMLHEDSTKYAIRGWVGMASKNYPEPEAYKVFDEAFDAINPAIRVYASQKWDEYDLFWHRKHYYQYIEWGHDKSEFDPKYLDSLGVE